MFAPPLRYCDSSNHSFAFIVAPCVNDRTIKIVAWKQAINKGSVVVIESFQNFWDKQQQQANRANMMHNMDMLKVAGYSFGKSLIDNLYDCFCLNQYPWEFSLHSLHMYNNTMSTSGTWNSSYKCTLKKPTDPGKSLIGLSNFFFLFHLEFC